VARSEPKAAMCFRAIELPSETRRSQCSVRERGHEKQFTMPNQGPNAFSDGNSAKSPYCIRGAQTRARSICLVRRRCTFRPRRCVTNLRSISSRDANSSSGSPRSEEGSPISGATCDRRLPAWSCGGRTDGRGPLSLVPQLPALDSLSRCDSRQTDHESDYYSSQVESINGLSNGLLIRRVPETTSALCIRAGNRY